jgi:Tfp pilus assembly protein PilV
LWQARGLDVLVQIVLIFAGVLGLLGLLAEAAAPLDQPAAHEVAAERQRQLQALERTAADVKPREEVHV